MCPGMLEEFQIKRAELFLIGTLPHLGKNLIIGMKKHFPVSIKLIELKPGIDAETRIIMVV
jgi:hypothetical protein